MFPARNAIRFTQWNRLEGTDGCSHWKTMKDLMNGGVKNADSVQSLSPGGQCFSFRGKRLILLADDRGGMME